MRPQRPVLNYVFVIFNEWQLFQHVWKKKTARLAESEQTHQRRIDELSAQKDQELAKIRAELESDVKARAESVESAWQQKQAELENRVVEADQAHQRRIDELNGHKEQEMSHLRGELETALNNIKAAEDAKNASDLRIQELEHK